MSDPTTTAWGSHPEWPGDEPAEGTAEIAGERGESTLAATNGPHLTDEDGRRIVDAMAELTRVSKGRIAAAVIPASWTDDQGKRLSRCINRVLEAGEAGLRTIEDVLHG